MVQILPQLSKLLIVLSFTTHTRMHAHFMCCLIITIMFVSFTATSYNYTFNSEVLNKYLSEEAHVNANMASILCREIFLIPFVKTKMVTHATFEGALFQREKEVINHWYQVHFIPTNISVVG